jgi:type II secretory ATPase GspE/PulE/Tfp pilus assembly ATPase PilB-like protein
VIKLVDVLLFEALGRGASDVHIQPLSDRTLIRYRLDGVLHTVRELTGSRDLATAIISRIKVMGKMDIAEKRIPQDGRASVSIGERSIDLRISTLPTSYGERAVLRLLDNSQQISDFESLGMPPEVESQFLERASRSSGIVLVTGPTGSGKTTTLYSTLRRIGPPSGGLNIMTIEDPIEYELATARCVISQSQVNPRKGVTFATGLRHILRQDPDVIMVGEIRDSETARIAIQSSLTGHLVFSTLHTNDAPSAITRLIDLDVEPYLVSASLSAVLAQRLVRLIHQACQGRGCEECFGSGFRGRTGLFELFTVDEPARQLIAERASLDALRVHARQRGMRTLHEDGLSLVEKGLTSLAEVQRIVHGAG